ncbi:MAG TPA: amidase [Dehalococcoidia bacterium]|nr:amidase [Dehalococcoidia bacterium]
MGFQLLEATIEEIETALTAREISSRELLGLYLDRIDTLDRSGPGINSIISLNPAATDEAERLDELLARSGPVGPLHGVPVILKDQIDAEGMPTTLGSVLFKDYMPGRDAFVVEKLKRAGAIVLGKATLGELGMGDTHGSLFGSTRNPYDLERTVGGSSGGPATAVSCNFAAVGVGQEALASIRRPAAWTCVVGMRPTAGLVSRSGVYAGWPGIAASLGPLTRGVADQARLLDVLTGYDSEDPITAMGVNRAPRSLADGLEAGALKGARIGVMRQSMGAGSEPGSADFEKVDAVFAKAVDEMARAGATLVDPIEIPKLRELMDRRGGGGGGNAEEAWRLYFARGKNPPFASRDEMVASPDYGKVHRGPVVARAGSAPTTGEYLQARDELMFGFMKVMADNNLDAIVHKSVEHQPTLISEGVKPPFVNIKGATSLNTFLVYVPAISVPAGFTTDGLPVGLTLTGRPYSDALMLRLAYAYEQNSHHRQGPPKPLA